MTSDLIANKNKISNKLNRKVYIAKSTFTSRIEGFHVGNGLFASKDLKKDEIAAYYSGVIQSKFDVQNKRDSTYYVSLWCNFVLAGDSSTGDLGIFANTCQNYAKQNSRFDLSKIVVYDSSSGIIKSTGYYTDVNISSGDRAVFPIVVISNDIKINDEIVVKYGDSHFKNLVRDIIIRDTITIPTAREQRQAKRSKPEECQESNS